MIEIIDLIPFSPGRISCDALAAMLGVSKRVVKQLVLNARMAGAVICSDQSGYYRPTTKEELIRYYSIARRGAMTRLRSLKVIRRILIEYGIDIAKIEGRK